MKILDSKITYKLRESLRGSDQLVDWVSIPLEISDDGVVEGLRHNWVPVQDPEISVGGAADDGISVVLGQSDNPVLGADVEGLDELDLELGVAGVFGDSLANAADFLAISDTGVVDLEGFVRVE